MIDNPFLRQPDQLVGLAGVTNRDSIALLGFLSSYVIVDNIPAYLFQIAFQRIAVAAAARQIDVNDLALVKVFQRFRVQSRAIAERDFTGSPALSAQKSWRSINRAIRYRAHAPPAFAAPSELGKLSQTAAPGSGAAGVRPQLPPLHHHRRKALDHLGGHARHSAGKPYCIQSVFCRPRARAADLKDRESKRRILAAPNAQPDRIGPRRHEAPRHRTG